MLRDINATQCDASIGMRVDTRYERNEKEDLKIAIDYLYEFKEKLYKLHPFVIHLMDQMLQKKQGY